MGMEMATSGGMTPAEAILTTNQGNGNNDTWGGGMWMVFFLFFLLAWGNGGWGGFGGNNASAQGALTRADLCQDMNFQNLESSVRGVQSGLCDGFYAMNTGMLNGFSGVQRDLCTGFATVAQGFDSVNQNINDSRYAMQSCCCETNRNIDATRYENARNTCDIVNAIRSDGEATRALINANTMQELRDRLESKDRALMSAEFQISQQAQNAYLVDAIKPCPIPAYLTTSPYAAYPYGLNGLNLSGGCCGAA
jgi:hypothetical protein